MQHDDMGPAWLVLLITHDGKAFGVPRSVYAPTLEEALAKAHPKAPSHTAVARAQIWPLATPYETYAVPIEVPTPKWKSPVKLGDPRLR